MLLKLCGEYTVVLGKLFIWLLLSSKQKLQDKLSISQSYLKQLHTQDIKNTGQIQSSLSGVKKVQIEDHLQGCHQAK